MINNKQQGSALIMALLTVAICAILATIIVSREQLLINTTSDIQQQTSLNLYSQGALLWAKWVLKQQSTQPKKYPLSMQTGRFKHLKINATIYDQNALFNLNSLRFDSNKIQFIRLMRQTNPKITIEQIQNIIQKLQLPLLIKNQLLQSKGITATIYHNIEPYITVLPNNDTNMMNLNDAPAIIIASLINISTEQAHRFVQIRKYSHPFASISDANRFLKAIGIYDKTFSNKNCSTAPSQYFLLKITITGNNQRFKKQLFLQRKRGDTIQSTKIQTIWAAF